MSNKNALLIMSIAMACIWIVTFGLEYADVPHVRKVAIVLTIALTACMVGAFLHFVAKRLF